jgi:hypothetical protein
MGSVNGKPVLAVLGVLLVVGVVFWNAAQAPKDDAASEAEAKNAEPRAISAAEKEGMARDIKGSLARSKPKEGSAVEGVPEVPIIVLPRIENFKPQPSDSNIATHWYKPQSRSAMQAEKGG